MHFDPVRVFGWRANSLHPFWGFVISFYGWGVYVHTRRPNEPMHQAFGTLVGVGNPLQFLGLYLSWLRPFEWRGD